MTGQTCWLISVILTLGRLRWKVYCEFKANLGYTVSSRQPELQSKIISERKLKQFVLNQIDFKSTAIALVNVQNTLNSIFLKKPILYKLPVKRTNFRKISSSEPRKIKLLNQIFFPKQMLFHTLINTNSKIHSNLTQFIMF